MSEKEKSSKPSETQKDDNPQNRHGVGTTQTTPKKDDETRVSAADPGHKDQKR